MEFFYFTVRKKVFQHRLGNINNHDKIMERPSTWFFYHYHFILFYGYAVLILVFLSICFAMLSLELLVATNTCRITSKPAVIIVFLLY
jgi:hypothetical protein